MINADLNWLSTVLKVPAIFPKEAALEGKTSLDTKIGEISTDSRSITPGQVFLALKGPNFDGSKFVVQVKEKGAIAVIVDQPIDVEITQFIVPDTLKALGQLGKAVIQSVNPKVIAITGSVGKTSVKEMCAAILARKGKVLATKGNFNNEIGVPLTLLRLSEDDEYAVVELGANHIGEIDYTSALTQPNVAILNNVAEAHLEGFGSIEGVVQAKGEIFNSLKENGLAIINNDADAEHKTYWLNNLYAQFKTRAGRIKSFGSGKDVYANKSANTDVHKTNKQPDFTASNVVLDEQGCAQFTLECALTNTCQKESISITLTIPGIHNVNNALAAAAACMDLGASLEDIQFGLANMSAVKGRVNLKSVNNNLLVIDDTYNANVQSVKAAIDLLASYQGQQLLVLGDMAELGTDARRLHEEVGEYALSKGIAGLFSFGVLSQNSSDVFQHNGHHFSSKKALTDKINEVVQQHALALTDQKLTVLVKGSRSAKMELVVEQVIADNSAEYKE